MAGAIYIGSSAGLIKPPVPHQDHERYAHRPTALGLTRWHLCRSRSARIISTPIPRRRNMEKRWKSAFCNFSKRTMHP